MYRNVSSAVIILIYVVITISLTADAISTPAKAKLHLAVQGRQNVVSNVTSNVTQNEYDVKTLKMMSKIYETAGKVFQEQLKQREQAQKGTTSQNGNNADKSFDEEYPSFFFDHYYPSVASNADSNVTEKYPGLIDTKEFEADDKDFGHRYVREIRKSDRKFCPGPHRPKKLYYSKSRKRALRPTWVSNRMRTPFSITETNGEDDDDWQLLPVSIQIPDVQQSNGGINDDNWRYKETSIRQDSQDEDDVIDRGINELTDEERCKIQSNELIAIDEEANNEEDRSQSKSRNIMDRETFARPFIEADPMPIINRGVPELNEAIMNEHEILTPVSSIPSNLLPRSSGQEFNYDNPNKWFLINRQCAGHKQSPIALFSRKAQPADLAKISFEYYEVPLSPTVEIHNNGHTAEVTINATIDGTRPSITGGGIDDIYEVVNVHFHWGSDNTKGSEHAINGRRYDLEMHIVHKNIKFSSMKEALKDPFGIAVLAVLFKKSESSDCNETELNMIYDALPSISEYDSVQCLEPPVTMKSFLGDLNTNLFFTYRGSLTTPPCAEAVTWFVFPDIIPIKTEYLERFFNLYDQRGLPILNNFRPLQSSFLRRIYYRKGGE